MEHLFTPCTRYRDIVEGPGDLEDFGGSDPEIPREINLDVSTEEFLSAERAFTFTDLYAMLGNGDTIAWLTPHTAVVQTEGIAEYACNDLDEMCRFRFSADDKEIFAIALSPEHLLEICDVVLQLLAVSVVHAVIIEDWSFLDDALIITPTLTYFMEQCQSLKVLTLSLEMDEDHCRMLGGYSRPGLEIELDRCKITSAGASALVEVLGHNQGPTKLDNCKIDNFVLANALRGNISLKSLRPHLSTSDEVSKREFLAIAGALRENKGLVDLKLWSGHRVSAEIWGAICDSLETHPTLEVLDLHGTSIVDPTTAPAVLKSRIQVLLDMMKNNTSMHTIRLDFCYRQHEIFRKRVIPYLETNRLRPRLLAIQKTRPITYRAKVLGQALVSATDPNSIWMLLSGNAEVAFPSRTTAVNLPSPATATAISTTDAAAFASPVSTAATTGLPPTAANAATSAATFSTASDAFPFAPTVVAATAVNVASPSPGQKRKALP
jgi:hypothetical protein